MNTASNKAKGRKGQQDVVKILLKTFTELDSDDLRSCPMGSQGEDVLMSPLARTVIPWNIEVKRGKAFNMVKACKQANYRVKPVDCPVKDCTEQELGCYTCKGLGKVLYEPVAIGRYDRDKTWYATVELDYLLELIS